MSKSGVRGEDHGNARLTTVEVQQIHKRAWDGEKQAALAAEYGVGQQLISAIKMGKRWSVLGLLPEDKVIER